MQYAGGHHHNTTEQGKDVQAARRVARCPSLNRDHRYSYAVVQTGEAKVHCTEYKLHCDFIA